jgi:hypothetical protein
LRVVAADYDSAAGYRVDVEKAALVKLERPGRRYTAEAARKAGFHYHDTEDA